MWTWITRECRLSVLPGTIIMLIVSYITWCCVLFYSDVIPPELYEGVEESNPFRSFGVTTDDFKWWVFLFFSAFIEEVLFRAPISLVVRKLKHPVIVVTSVTGLSVLFGYIHLFTWWSVLIQGVFGFMISVAYLKFGGAQGKIIKPLFCATIAHFASNATLFLMHDYGVIF